MWFKTYIPKKFAIAKIFGIKLFTIGILYSIIILRNFLRWLFMKEIKRDFYLNQLIKKDGNGQIKVYQPTE